MARTTDSATKSARPPSHKNGDGSEVTNQILRDLPTSEYKQVHASLELVRLKLHQVLHEAGESIKSVYFPNDGLSSVLTVQPNGKSVEVGLIGREGFVGIPVIFGFKTSSTRVVTQADGKALRLDITNLQKLLPQCPTLERALQRFSLMLSMQSTQLAACNRLHGVEERLARWLLMSQDRIATDKMPLTQEFLGQMLGTRRSSVSLAASMLQKAGMIRYTRGSVTMLNRRKLEESACECYSIIQDQRKKWEAELA